MNHPLDTHPHAALIRERIARGITWLDTEKPNWREELEVVRLDLSSCSSCVLGQIFDPIDQDPWAPTRTGFGVGTELLNERCFGDDIAPAVLYGFDTWDDADSPYTYDALEAGWLEVLS